MKIRKIFLLKKKKSSQKNSKIELNSEKEENDYFLNSNEKQEIKINITEKIKENKASKNGIKIIKSKSIYKNINNNINEIQAIIKYIFIFIVLSRFYFINSFLTSLSNKKNKILMLNSNNVTLKVKRTGNIYI